MTTAIQYDRSAIMQSAWKSAKAFMSRNPNGRLRPAFSRYLREAWVNAKTAVRFAREQLELSARTIESLRAEIEDMENTDVLGVAAINRLGSLRAALATALNHRSSVKEYSEKRALIASAQDRLCVVTFVKKDGRQRTMRVQPAALVLHTKGDAATDAGKRAVQTRKARHPNLLPVWDAEAQAARSVNLATVSQIAVGGLVHTFAV